MSLYFLFFIFFLLFSKLNANCFEIIRKLEKCIFIKYFGSINAKL